MSNSGSAIKDLYGNWIELRGVTKDLLSQLSADELRTRFDRPGLNTIVKHLEEMLDVEAAYLKSMSSGDVDFSGVKDVKEYAGDSTIKDLQARFRKADMRMKEIIEGKNYKSKVDFGYPLPVIRIFAYLLAHEAFHQGQIALAMYGKEIPVPESWVAQWALPKD